jgi:hypothetical protein
MPSVRVALAIFVCVNAVMALWTYYQYQRMLDYCTNLDGAGLECLGGTRAGQIWAAVSFEVSIWIALEVAALVVLGAALVNRRRPY